LLVDLAAGESVGQQLLGSGPGRPVLIVASEEANQGDHTENHQRPKQHHADRHQRVSPAIHSRAIPEHHFHSFSTNDAHRLGYRAGTMLVVSSQQIGWPTPSILLRPADLESPTKVLSSWPKVPFCSPGDPREVQFHRGDPGPAPQ